MLQTQRINPSSGWRLFLRKREITDESKTPDHPPLFGEIARVPLGQIVCFAESKNRKILLLSDRKTAMKCFALHLTNDKRFHFVTPKYFSVFYFGTLQTLINNPFLLKL